MNVIKRLLDVSSADPDDARRRQLLNILLLGLAVLVVIGFVATSYAGITGLEDSEGVTKLLVASSATATILGVVFVINRYGTGWLASSLMLLFFILIVAFTDEPHEVAGGRSLIMFTIPIVIASVVLRPAASFVMAGLCSIVITVLALRTHIVPNPFAMMAFFTTALASWLAAYSLERALKDLRALNRELDQRVEERTRDLATANKQLAEANEQLRELDWLKSIFLAMVSHDLRTPLNAILGFAEMLEANIYGPLSDKQTVALERIIANTGRLLVLVNDLLDQACIEAGQLSLHVTSFALKDMIEESLSGLHTLAQSKDLELTSHIAEGVPAMLSGDRHRLQQILTNLVDNAIKFTEQGGVYVRIFRPNSERWALEVSDTGSGIPEEEQEIIFDPFRQVDSSITRTHRGVGLGLSIVEKLVALMNGEIALHSEVGRGSTFTVVLPLEPAQEEAL